MSEEDEHLHLIRKIVDNQISMEGEKVALGRARAAPLEINPDKEITDYYGSGKSAVDLLAQQYEEVWGQDVADGKIKSVVKREFPEEMYDEIPERIRPEKGSDSSEGLLGKVKDKLF